MEKKAKVQKTARMEKKAKKDKKKAKKNRSEKLRRLANLEKHIKPIKFTKSTKFTQQVQKEGPANPRKKVRPPRPSKQEKLEMKAKKAEDEKLKKMQEDESKHEEEEEEEEDSMKDETGTTEESVKKETREKREKKKFDFERNSRTIFVGNLPNSLDHKGLAKIFKSCGKVESARIRSVVPEKEKLSPKVALITNRMHPKVDSFNGYVVFSTNENDECVKKALAMNGNVIDGHHIRVDRAQRPKARKETLSSRKKSIFVGNLRYDLRDDELINHFNKVGNVDYVRIVRDRGSGLGKGFAFVVFTERADVKKALELNETQFKGRTLRIKKVEVESKS